MSYALASALVSGANAASSFADGWAQMKFQLDRQAMIENQWMQEFAMRKQMHDDQFRLNSQRLALEVQKEERQQEFHTQQMKNAQLQYKMVNRQFELNEQSHEQTGQAWGEFLQMFPATLSVGDPAKRSRMLGDMSLAVIAKYPYASRETLDTLIGLFDSTLSSLGSDGGHKPQLEWVQNGPYKEARWFFPGSQQTVKVNLKKEFTEDVEAKLKTINEKWEGLVSENIKALLDVDKLAHGSGFLMINDPTIPPEEKIQNVANIAAKLNADLRKDLPELRSFAKNMLKAEFIDPDTKKVMEEDLDAVLDALVGKEDLPITIEEAKEVVSGEFESVYERFGEDAIDEMGIAEAGATMLATQVDYMDIFTYIQAYMEYVNENMGRDAARAATDAFLKILNDRYNLNLNLSPTAPAPIPTVPNPANEYPGKMQPPIVDEMQQQQQRSWLDVPLYEVFEGDWWNKPAYEILQEKAQEGR